jgi:hypothetical protein
MKKYVLLLSLTLLAIMSARADLIWYEGFNYADGNIPTTSSGIWARQSGSLNDAFVKNHKLEISASSPGIVPRTDDVNRKLAVTAGSPYTNSVVNPTIYASFTVNVTNFPNAAGTYFAHFINGASTFMGKVWALSNNAALPNTFRIGASSASSTAPSQVFPIDLATNTDYQVVVEYDQANQAASLWVNPIASVDSPLVTFDSGSAAQIQGFATRQAGSFGNFFGTLSNLAVATTYDEAATNVWSTNAIAPVIAYGLKNTTNFVGDNAILYVVASGQGLDKLTYQWRKGGVNITNPAGNTNVFAFNNAQISDSGSYDVVVTTPYGMSVTAPAKFFNVSNAPIPPTITSGPANTTTYPHSTVTFHVVASGPPTITYQWYLNNALLNDGPNFSGSASDTLIISDITATDGTVGTYKIIATNPYGSATNSATITLTNPAAVSVAFLRTLVDSNFAATNTTTFYQVTGHVTTLTNLTSGNTSSYYLQDGSGAGINIFATLAQTFRPQLGDVITWVGPLSNFQGNLELTADASNPATSYTVLSNDVPGLPAAKVIAYNAVTNNMTFTETNLVGSVVMLTNAYFTNSGIVINGSASTSTTVTNTSGQNFNLFFSAQDLDTQGQTLPDFAWSIIGVLTINTNNAQNKGLAVTVTRFSDIVVAAPPAVTISTSHTGNNTTLSWTAVPYNYSYSVSASTDVNGPYLPLKTGLVFTTTNGTYTDTAATGPQKFYRVTTP